MSNSILHHTFGISSVQHFSTDFLTARPFSTARFMTTVSSARTVNLVMLSVLDRLKGLSKHCLSATTK